MNGLEAMGMLFREKKGFIRIIDKDQTWDFNDLDKGNGGPFFPREVKEDVWEYIEEETPSVPSEFEGYEVWEVTQKIACRDAEKEVRVHAPNKIFYCLESIFSFSRWSGLYLFRSESFRKFEPSHFSRLVNELEGTAKLPVGVLMVKE